MQDRGDFAEEWDAVLEDEGGDVVFGGRRAEEGDDFEVVFEMEGVGAEVGFMGFGEELFANEKAAAVGAAKAVGFLGAW